MQGQVLAYNNMTYQVSMIVAPLVAGAIYMWNHEWVLYSSAIIAVIGALTMGYMCTWKDVKTIGKKMNVKRELDEMEVKVEGENAKPDEQKVENQKLDEQKMEGENQKQEEQKKGEEKKAEPEQQTMNTESAAPAPESNQEVSISI